MPFPCHAAKCLECVFTVWFTQCGRVWFTLAMPHPCPALTMPFFSRPQHSTVIERRPVGYLPPFSFFRLPRRVPQRFLSEAYQSSSQWSIPTTLKSGSSTLQKRRSVKTVGLAVRIFPATTWTLTKDTALSSRAGAHGICELMNGMAGGMAWVWHGHGMPCVNRPLYN